MNQRVAIGILEKRGHAVIVANNGREAIEAIAMQRFDLVLMDVQMPEMDGIEATRLIRETEAARDEHTPIVAMTAHAMKGDQETCLQAGMDDYLSKPVQVKELLATIARLTPSKDEAQARPTATRCVYELGLAMPSSASSLPALSNGPAEQEDAVDMPTLLARVENDMDLLREMVELFLDDAPRLLAEIDATFARQDSRGIERAAHALKGSMQSISALPAAHAAAALEETARTGDVFNAHRPLSLLKLEFDRLVSALSQTSPGDPS